MKTEDVLKENARTVQVANNRNSLLCDGTISEIARTFLRDATLIDPTHIYESVMGENLCTPEFAKYCVFVCDETRKMSAADFLPESVVVASDPQTARIAYQQNYHSDRAYSLFFRTVQYEVQAIYRPTTVSVCEEVYYGRCTHCILPIYSSTDGIFPTIAKLMDKYDLIINAEGATATNNDGGVNGGITNGNPIVVRAAVKPTPSIARSQQTFDFERGEVAELQIKGRHDACIALRAAVVVESAVAIVLADLWLRHRSRH